MASREYRQQWHEYLPLLVLNHKTSYHASIGCEPTRVFHGRVPYKILDHKLGNNSNEQITPTSEFAEKIQNQTKRPINKTKHNIMQSYVKYKEYFDRKAKRLHSRKTFTVLYCSQKRIIKDQRLHSEITNGLDHL